MRRREWHLTRPVSRPTKYAVVLFAMAVAFCQPMPAARASDPIGDFFKRVGRTLTKPHPSPSKQNKRKSSTTRAKTTQPTDPAAPGPTADQATPQPTEPAPPPSTPAVVQPTVRAASSVPQSSGNRDLPYAVPVPNRPGFVTSPYAPTRGFVDVREFPSGTEVKDPYTGKLFRTP